MSNTDILNENFKVIEDFAVISGFNNNTGEIYGLFYHMKDYKYLPIIPFFTSPNIQLDDKPFGTIEFNSRYGDIELSKYAKNILNIFGYEKDKDIYRPSSNSYRQFTKAVDVYFSNKWKKLYSTISNSYDYTKPFDVTLTENMNINKSNNNTKKVDSTLTKNGSSSSNVSNDVTNNSIYAFGSTSDTPTDKSSHIYTDNGSENSSNISSENVVENGSIIDSHNRTYSRKGNIGNISLSRLTNEERETSKYIIIEEIFKDIADLLGNGIFIYK